MSEIKVGIVGLGRLGKVHARNIAFKIPRAKLVGACSIMEAELQYAKEELKVSETFTSYEEMLDKADLDAVAIVSSSPCHCDQIEKALAKGLHVFTEKPLGVDVVECKKAEKAVEAHPDQVFFLGFMRRFDPSYSYAKKKIEEGAIGTPYMVKATGIDPEAAVEGAIKFAPTSGGLFIDMASHDVDLIRWFLGSEVKEVYALGANFKHPEFLSCNDTETGAALFQLENGGIAELHVGRTAAHGYHIETEIVGTEGSIRISPVPEKNLAILYDRYGVRQECVESFPERFDEAYLLEMQEFIQCIIEKKKPKLSVYDGTRATEICFAMKKSFEEKRLVKLGE